MLLEQSMERSGTLARWSNSLHQRLRPELAYDGSKARCGSAASEMEFRISAMDIDWQQGCCDPAELKRKVINP